MIMGNYYNLLGFLVYCLIGVFLDCILLVMRECSKLDLKLDFYLYFLVINEYVYK